MLLSKLLKKKEDTPAADPNEEQLAKEEEEAVKGEKNLKRILEAARKLYFEKRIAGTIDVARSFAVHTTSLSCDIDGTQAEDDSGDNESVIEDEVEAEKLSRFEKIAMNSLVRAINTLENRAKAYRNRPYKNDLSISTGVYVTDPFLGISTLSISCSATVSSLLNMSSAARK